jgi:hypothetical protein
LEIGHREGQAFKADRLRLMVGHLDLLGLPA